MDQKILGMPTNLSQDELVATLIDAQDSIHDEASRANGIRDPAEPVISDSDLAALRAKFPFLKDFSDGLSEPISPTR
jgi:hypothetical protein